MSSATHATPEVDAASVRAAYILTAKLLALIERFEAARVQVLPLKGPVLSQAMYGDPATRAYEDLDLLVHQKDVARAFAVLAECGYVPHSGLSWIPTEKLVKIVWEIGFRDAMGTTVDLHWDIAPRDLPYGIGPEILWANIDKIRIAEREVPTLTAECQFLYLSLHGAKHAWNYSKWAVDIARLLEITPAMNWDRVLKMAGSRGGEHVVLLAALLARDLCGSRLPEPVGERITRDRVIHSLAGRVKARFAKEGAAPLTAFEFTAFNAAMADSTWDKIRHYAALLKAPTEADAQFVQLPAALFWMYYPLRVVRLAGKYLRRVVGGRRASARVAQSH